jgi:hypothetical protein
VKPGLIVPQRDQLVVNYTNKALKMGITFQDIRTWGDVSFSNKMDAGGTAVQPAWADKSLVMLFQYKVAVRHCYMMTKDK